jgi:hypothetical protein
MVPGFEGIRRFIELNVVGRLTVPGVSPEIIAVYLEDSPCDEPGGIARPEVNIIADSNRPIRFNATVYDVNGDCNGGLTFYICANETAVPPTYCSADYRVDSPISATLYVQYGGPNNNLYCNYTGIYNLPYFRRCGVWYVNVTALDVGSHSNSTVRWWKDNLGGGVEYPYVNGVTGDVVYMGIVTLDQWNPNMGRNTTKNTGNTNFTSLVWNATNFTRTELPYDVIGITDAGYIGEPGNTTFALDDDEDRMNGAGYINENPSVQIQFPAYGVYRCEDLACTSARAKYDLWWHIHVPPAISSGIYENVIQYNFTSMNCE